MAGHKSRLTSDIKSKSTTSTSNSPTLDELKKDLFVAIEILNGYTEAEALMNYECEQGTCQCP
jgi:hypothetical protein